MEIEPWSNSYFSNKLNILVKFLNWSEESIAKMTLLFRNVMKRYGNMRTCELLNIYRPQRSCGKVHVIFSQASVSHSVHGGVCLSACWGTTSPQAGTPWQVHPARTGTPPWAGTPCGQVHPPGRYTPYWNTFLSWIIFGHIGTLELCNNKWIFISIVAVILKDFLLNNSSLSGVFFVFRYFFHIYTLDIKISIVPKKVLFEELFSVLCENQHEDKNDRHSILTRNCQMLQ